MPLAIANGTGAPPIKISSISERCSGSFRRGVLDMYLFRNLSEVREKAEAWIADYNEQIPHDSLGGLSPTADDLLVRETSFFPLIRK